MFADSLLESNWANRSHRGWTTLASFAMQALAVGILLMLPLIFSEGLPKLRLTTIGTPIGAPPGRQPRGPRHPSGPARPIPHPFQIVALVQVPSTIARGGDEAPDPGPDVCTGCVPGGTGIPESHSPVLESIGGSALVPPPPPPAPTVKTPPISRMMEGNLIYKPQPVYPPMARAARIQGAVLLRAIISKRGTIENLEAMSGHPLLIPAAINAVKQWRYRPYVLNGEPVEVETRVTVNFILSGG
jgi:protein TonB